MLDEQTKQLVEAINSAPVGTFKLFRASEEEPEVEQSMANMGDLSSRIAHAKKQNCLIEVISLRIQYMDIWLRVFYKNVHHEDERPQEFGRLLKQCFKLGLDKTLYDEILKFNKDRVKAIHGYLIGRTSYNELKEVVYKSSGLSEKLAEFVVMNSGEPVTSNFVNQHHNRGDKVYHIPNLLQDLRSRESI